MAIDIFCNLMRKSYYKGREIKFLSPTKSDVKEDFAFITLMTQEWSEDILINGPIYHSERLKISITKDKEMDNLSSFRINTTIVANNLHQRESHQPSPKSSSTFLERKTSRESHLDTTPTIESTAKLDGATFNASMRRVTRNGYGNPFTFLGDESTSSRTKKNIDHTKPNPTAIRLAHAPVWEVIVPKAQATPIGCGTIRFGGPWPTLKWETTPRTI